MNKIYKSITDTVKADLEKIDKNLDIKINLKKEFSQELYKFIHSKSKQIRSVVCLLYMRASKMYLLPEHYELLAAVEIMHNVSLIHDDVIDESKFRRERKTLNELFDNKLAVLSGDYLLAEALKKLVKIDSCEIINIFAQTLSKMCEGEICQYYFKNKITNIEEYIEKSSLKTASLFEAALKASVILADGNFDDKAAEFITNFGIAFQIRDDLLNVLNRNNTKNMTDAQSGIYNAPYILDDNLDKGIEKTRDLLNNYINCSKQCIEDLQESPYKSALNELLELIRDV